MHEATEIQYNVRLYICERTNLEYLNTETNIFEEGLVNSLFAIELMTFLEKSFDIKVGMDDLDMTYYQSIEAITTFVQRKEKEKVR